MSAASSTTIVIITGAWHTPEHYARLSNRLRHLGFRVECPLLSTNNNTNPPNKTVDDDIEQIRNLVSQILSKEQDVIAIMHSYGGVVGTAALAGLGQKDRVGQSCVKHLVYMTALLPLEHESLAAIFGGGLPPWLSPNDQGLIDVSDPSHHFYNDLASGEQEKWVDKLVVHPRAAQFDAPNGKFKAAWRTVPTTYLMCNKDQALPIEVQEMMAGRIEQAQPGLRIRREYCDASHSPFLSMPEAVVAILAPLYKD